MYGLDLDQEKLKNHEVNNFDMYSLDSTTSQKVCCLYSSSEHSISKSYWFGSLCLVWGK